MNILELKQGTAQKRAKIIHVYSQPFKEGAKSERVYFDTISDDGSGFKVNEIWIRDHNGQVVPKSLWLSLDVNGNILSSSLLGRFLDFMRCSSIAELKDREIILEPKENDFMAVVAYEK